MAISGIARERLKAVARELVNLADGEVEQTTQRTFADIEDDSIEVTDLLAQMLIEERLARQISNPSPSVCCPACQNQIAFDEDEPRAILTNRGEAWIL